MASLLKAGYHKDVRFVCACRRSRFSERASTSGTEHKKKECTLRKSCRICDAKAKNVKKEAEFETEDQLNEEYFEYQNQIVTGTLPCSGDDAAALSSLQLCIEERWPHNIRELQDPSETRLGIGDRIRSLGRKILTKRPDAKHFDPQDGGASMVGKKKNHEAAKNGETGWCNKTAKSDETPRKTEMATIIETVKWSSTAAPKWSQIIKVKMSNQIECCRQWFRKGRYGPDAHFHEPLKDNLKARSLPPEYRKDKRVAKLIKAHKRKLFYVKSFDIETDMKRLYVQCCRRLPANGCRVFPVTEVTRTENIERLLCISPTQLHILDAYTKLLVRSQWTSDLLQWVVDGRVIKHCIRLEFAKSNWELAAPNYTHQVALTASLWENSQIVGVANASKRP